MILIDQSGQDLQQDGFSNSAASQKQRHFSCRECRIRLIEKNSVTGLNRQSTNIHKRTRLRQRDAARWRRWLFFFG